MASRQSRRPDGGDRRGGRPSPGEAAAPRGSHIGNPGIDPSYAANDNGFGAVGRGTRRAARALTWVALAAVAGIVAVVALGIV
jgi:hypothetical protein